jgi:hypothetical protein
MMTTAFYMVRHEFLDDHQAMDSWLASKGVSFYHLIAEDIKGWALIEVADYETALQDS